MFNYQEYLIKNDAITMEQALEIYKKMSESIDPGDQDGV